MSVDAQGVITDISSPGQIDSLPGVEFYSGILIPAMVNAHCHLELSALCGAIPSGGGFAGFARAMGATRRDTPGRTQAIAAQDAVLWQQGVGAVADICNGDATFASKTESPIRYHNFLELFGLRTPAADALDPLVRAASQHGLPWSVTPHSTYSLQSAAFEDAVARGGSSPDAPLSIHFMESPGERELFERRGELWDWYRAQGMETDFLGFGSPAGRVIAQVPCDRPAMLVHNTFITEEDVDRLTDHFGDRITFVLCPRSNRYITGATPPVGLLRRKGVRIALGTDSLASNTSLSLIEEMKTLDGIPLEELLGWATTGGAEALGIGGSHGSIEIGKAPGLALLTGIDWDAMRLLPEACARRIL